MASNENRTWPADVKNAEGRVDPNVLPEYTLLPASPAQSVVSYNDLEAGIDRDARSSASTATADAQGPTLGGAAESPSVFKLLYTGLLAIAFPPMILFWVGLAMGAMTLYGCGKILEAIGRALAFIPEAVYRRWGEKRAKGFLGAVREEGRAQEGGQVEIVEGQVALEDVEAGQGGPISI